MQVLPSTVRNVANALITNRCANPDCSAQGWQLWIRQGQGIRLNDMWFCSECCVRSALLTLLGNLSLKTHESVARVHRLPLGLLMLSRKLIDESQLRAALKAQHDDPNLRIGEWVERLGWVSEEDITRALAAQHSVPVLSEGEPELGSAIPLALLRTANCATFRGNFDQQVLYVGFETSVDRSLLAAADFVLRRHCEPCIVSSRIVQQQIEIHSRARETTEIAFETVSSVPEMARTICSYAERVRGEEIRIASTRSHLWVKLTGARPLDLTFTLT